MSDEENDKLVFEFLDGSSYQGRLPRDNGNKGQFSKKLKNNCSFITAYDGPWVNGYPHGDGGNLSIKLKNWPQYHLARRKAKSFQKGGKITFNANFNEGEMDGITEIVVDDAKKYSTLFQKGLEIP